ncbi:MAG: flavin reductase family protein [Oscillospiraceae bacterium]|nr:flavin reductase family protein [Oscillospiraceae bacterium]
MEYQKIEPSALTLNPFEAIGKSWLLITAGDRERYNTMTASWGSLGVLWNKNVATVYIRPQRYTKEFLDRQEMFSLTFFGEEYRDALVFCGRNSGRDCNKAESAGLTPFFDLPAPAFREGKLILICKKQYAQPLSPSCFTEAALASHYPAQDYHTVYIGEIIEAYRK